MAQFLRDQQIRNYSITIDRIDELYTLFQKYALELQRTGVEVTYFSCVIRFDGKGNRVWTLEDLKQSYRQAKQVERVIFMIETVDSLRTNRAVGPFMELRLDRVDQNGFFTVTADTQTWVDGAFSAVGETLRKARAWYGFVRQGWVELVIQVTGVILVFLLSLATAKQLTPHISADNPLLFSFIFVFLLCANIWGYLQRAIHVAILQVFPNVDFIKEGREHLHWFPQGFVAALVSIVVTYAANGAANVLFRATGAFLK